MQFLIDFAAKCAEASPVDASSMLTSQVVQRFVVQPTAKRRCSYIDSGVVLGEDVSTPSFIVIHRCGLDNHTQPNHYRVVVALHQTLPAFLSSLFQLGG